MRTRTTNHLREPQLDYRSSRDDVAGRYSNTITIEPKILQKIGETHWTAREEASSVVISFAAGRAGLASSLGENRDLPVGSTSETNNNCQVKSKLLHLRQFEPGESFRCTLLVSRQYFATHLS
jgi:hypothetical protein